MSLLKVPHRRQATAWSCGPACVRMVLAYYKERVPERDLIAPLCAMHRNGTPPSTLVSYFKANGYGVTARQRRSLRDIGQQAARGFPTIVCFQAWPCCPKVDLSQSLDHGHYAVIVGVDAERVTLIDPAATRRPRKIPRGEFLNRWRDIDARGNIFTRWGLTVSPRT